MTPKIACPSCGDYDSKVTNTRPRTSGGVYRRRECLVCKHRFSTLETVYRYPSTKFQPAHKP
jgi:transcriptional repressor NrdR